MFNAGTGVANCDDAESQSHMFCSVHPGGGVPRFFSHLKSSFICEVKPHAKFQNPRTNPFGRKDCGGGLLCVI